MTGSVKLSQEELLALMVNGENDLVMTYLKNLPDGEREKTTDALVQGLNAIKGKSRRNKRDSSKRREGSKKKRSLTSRSHSLDQTNNRTGKRDMGSSGSVTNETFDIKFTILADIGKGEVSEVYKAEDKERGCIVAMKKFPDRLYKKNRLNILMDAYAVLASLDHDNIIPVYSYNIFGDEVVISMEYYSNGTLFEILTENGSFPESLTAYCTNEILVGISFLHKNGITHTNLRCENVFIDDNMRIVIGDFVTSSDTENPLLTEITQPYWMAPERIQMIKRDNRTDIWSLGCCVIEMLTGKPPHYDLKHNVACFKIVHDALPPIPDGLSSELNDFLRLTFHKQFENRVRSKDLLAHPWLSLGSSPKTLEEIKNLANNSTPLTYPSDDVHTTISKLRDQIGFLTSECESLKKKANLLETMNAEKRAEKKKLKKQYEHE